MARSFLQRLWHPSVGQKQTARPRYPSPQGTERQSQRKRVSFKGAVDQLRRSGASFQSVASFHDAEHGEEGAQTGLLDGQENNEGAGDEGNKEGVDLELDDDLSFENMEDIESQEANARFWRYFRSTLYLVLAFLFFGLPAIGLCQWKGIPLADIFAFKYLSDGIRERPLWSATQFQIETARWLFYAESLVSCFVLLRLLIREIPLWILGVARWTTGTYAEEMRLFLDHVYTVRRKLAYVLTGLIACCAQWILFPWSFVASDYHSYLQKGMTALSVNFVLFLIKTVFIEVLAVSFHATIYHDRRQALKMHLAILGTICAFHSTSSALD